MKTESVICLTLIDTSLNLASLKIQLHFLTPPHDVIIHVSLFLSQTKNRFNFWKRLFLFLACMVFLPRKRARNLTNITIGFSEEIVKCKFCLDLSSLQLKVNIVEDYNMKPNKIIKLSIHLPRYSLFYPNTLSSI